MKSGKTLKHRWCNEEYKIAIEEMKKAREKWLQKGRRENEEQEYVYKRKESHKNNQELEKVIH